MEFLHSITVYKCGVYSIPEKLQMITTFSTYYGTDLVFPVNLQDETKNSCVTVSNLTSSREVNYSTCTLIAGESPVIDTTE